MTEESPRRLSLAFKAKVALAALKGEGTRAQQAQRFNVRPSEIMQWTAGLLGLAKALGVHDAPSAKRENDERSQAQRAKRPPIAAASPAVSARSTRAELGADSSDQEATGEPARPI